MSSIIYDVDLATDVKSFVVSNWNNILFDNSKLKDAIMKADNDDLLRVGKIINSPMKIVSVDIVDANFFKRYLFKDGIKN